MKRILALIMVLSLTLCAALPAMAQAAAGDFSSDSVATPTTIDSSVQEDSGEIPVLGESEGTNENIPLPADEPLPEELVLPDELPPEDTIQTILPDGGVIMPMSGWIGEDSEFFTRIRILVSDSTTGQPIRGAEFALYRSDDTFMEYLTTDYYGTATSSDVSVYYDYYLVEYNTPEGYQANHERKNIVLTEECAPSRVDVYAEYDPITGHIKVIKTNENGDPLPGVSFHVYSYHSGSYVEDITTDENGEALTGELPYGWFEFYEYSAPAGYATGGSWSAMTDEHGEIEELHITNYLARGSLRITKTGNDGRAIGSAVFSLFNAETDEWIEDIITNTSGYAYSSDLMVGDYYAVEKSVPNPYKLDTEPQYFSITYSGQTYNMSVVNEVDGQNGRVKIIKTDDGINPVPLDGVVFGLFRAWDNKRVESLTTGADGTVESSLLIPGDYYLVEETGKSGYTTVSGQIPFSVDGSGTTVEKTVVNPKERVFGKVKVVKVDDEGNPIPGISFGIYCVAKDNLLGELTSSEDGTDTSGVLNAGDYYLLERNCDTVDGYVISTERHPFTIDTSGEIVTVTVVNPRISGAVKVIKTGDSSEMLPGVVFGIYDAETDTEIGKLTTGEDGTATSNTLYYGGYYLKELSTVEGYELLNTPIPFSILEQDVVLEIPVTNPLITGGVTIIKISGQEIIPSIVLLSEDTEDPYAYLSGAVFGLYNSQGQKLAELTTGEDGRAVYEGLPRGLYYLLELKSPEGHVLSGDMIGFRIDEQGQMVEKIVSNSKGYGVIEVHKTGESDEALPGVKFEIIRVSTGEKAGEITTDENGIASIELPLGHYSLVETVTVQGYTLLSGSISFALETEGETMRLNVQNQREQVDTGKIKLIKVDSADNKIKLAGATFGIFRTIDNVKVGEITTDSDGTAVSLDLPIGEYYLLEQKAPTSYSLNPNRQPVTVTSGKTIEITVSNTLLPPETGTVKIIKKNDDGKLLEGALFFVYSTDTDKKVGELKTGKNGIATLELPRGSYYLREQTAPEGHRLSDEKVSFFLNVGETKELTLLNSKLTDPPATGNLQIIKSAAGTGERLEGAVFGVYREGSNTKIAELTTDAGGNASMELERGDYYLRELRAPRGFVAEKNAIPFSITSGNSVVRVEVTNTTGVGTLRLTKTGTDGKAIAGAVFTIYNWNGYRVTDITTGSDGTVVYELPAGPHYIVEKSVPNPYKLDTSEHVVVIEAGKRTDLKVVNEVIKQPDPTTPTTPPTQSAEPGPSVGITIPKTGQDFPAVRYMLQALCLVVAAGCGMMLYRMRKRGTQAQA